MSLVKTFQEIKKSLSRNLGVFAEGRTRHRVLARYGSPLDVVAAVASTSPLTTEERDVLLVAILSELRLTKHRLWQSMLVAAFEPLLVRIRTRLGRPGDEDVDQNVFLAFLEAAHSLRIDSHAARILRLAVQRRAFDDRRREQDVPETSEFIDDTHCVDPFDVSVREKAAAHEVVSILEAEGGEELRDVMLATRAHEETLRAYVERKYAGQSDRERGSAYQRLIAARRRAEKRLRERAHWREQRRHGSAA